MPGYALSKRTAAGTPPHCLFQQCLVRTTSRGCDGHLSRHPFFGVDGDAIRSSKPTNAVPAQGWHAPAARDARAYAGIPKSGDASARRLRQRAAGQRRKRMGHAGGRRCRTAGHPAMDDRGDDGPGGKVAGAARGRRDPGHGLARGMTGGRLTPPAGRCGVGAAAGRLGRGGGPGAQVARSHYDPIRAPRATVGLIHFAAASERHCDTIKTLARGALTPLFICPSIIH